MKFKIKRADRPKHTELVACVGWSNMNELFSIGDDQQIWKWDINGEAESKVMDIDAFVISMDWFPVAKGNQEVLALSCADGSFKLISKAGRVEKNVSEAHSGAIIQIKWNYEGTALATAGEDGQVKVWSRGGMLRFQLVNSNKPIYSVSWSPDNNSILYASEKNLTIMPTLPGNKQTQWKAHDGIVLGCDWNPANNLIISCGEDNKYRVWDQFGRQLYNSSPYDHVITSCKWAPNGDYFAVGSFEMIRLCDKSGWSHSFDKPQCGSILNLSWSHDGTMVAGAGGNGQVVFGNIVDRQLSWAHIEAVLDQENKIVINDCLHEMNDDLDFRERVVNMSMKHNHLIVCTTSQCYVYNVMNWTSPFVFDIKDVIYLIIQGAKYFALIDAQQNFNIYSYEGKLVSTPVYQGLRVEFLNQRHISLSSDVLAVIDPSNPKIVKVFDIQSGRPTNTMIEHSCEIIEMDLNQVEMASERKMCFIDTNRDLHISMVHKPDVHKICNMVDSFQWNDNNDMLTALSDGKLKTWFYPNSIYVDRDLMNKAMSEKDASDVGKMGTITQFNGNLVTIRRLDGSLATLGISPYPKMLYEHIDKADFEKAIRMCRFVKEQTLWACLASMSIYCRELNTVEIALAAIDEADKVQYINYIKELPSEPSRNAALALYCKKFNEAEQILLQARLFYRAIKLNIKSYKWERALDIAVQNRTHVDTVIAYR